MNTRKATPEDFARMLGMRHEALDPEKIRRARETVFTKWLRRGTFPNSEPGFAALCESCRSVVAEECTVGHMGRRTCERCGEQFIGQCQRIDPNESTLTIPLVSRRGFVGVVL